MTAPRLDARASRPSGQISRVPNPFLGLIPRELWSRLKDFFVYTANFIPLTASSTQTTNVSIQNDSDFLIIYGVGTVTDTTEASRLTYVPQLVQLRDSSSGRELFDQATHYHNIFGTAEEPAYWSFPKLLRAGSTFSVTLQNLEATDRRVRIAFAGFKVFPMDA